MGHGPFEDVISHIKWGIFQLDMWVFLWRDPTIRTFQDPARCQSTTNCTWRPIFGSGRCVTTPTQVSFDFLRTHKRHRVSGRVSGGRFWGRLEVYYFKNRRKFNFKNLGFLFLRKAIWPSTNLSPTSRFRLQKIKFPFCWLGIWTRFVLEGGDFF